MTGIERLRELIESYRKGNECDGIECGGLSCGECMAKNVLEPIADQIEREHAEDAETAAWVRGHGGLDALKRRVDAALYYESVAKVLLSRLGALNAADEPAAAREAMDRLEGRATPEGYAWPRDERGEKVLVGSDFVDELERVHIVTSIRFLKGEVALHWNPEEPEECMCLHPGERVRRPAPKVLDADGMEIRVGDTVWDVDSGTEYEVVGIHTDEDSPVRVMRTDDTHLAKATKPSQLTHERPDSWERLEEDATISPDAYCVKRGIDFSDVDGRHRVLDEVTERMARDLVRRAKALAERDA